MASTEKTSKISTFFDGRSVLITGGTGFMGKVLIEKLLRSCSGIKMIYLLMRPKNQTDVKQRLEKLLTSKIFDPIRRDSSDILNKLFPIHGDVMLENLGIGESDRDVLVREVSVVFHAAATVKFDESLKLSVKMNIVGTKKLLELCHRMRNLVSVVHISTAYCNCDKLENYERVSPTFINPNQLIEMVEWMDDSLVDFLTPKLLQNHPNTYTYTKSLAEQLILDHGQKLPLAIVRPSIVTASWKEPLPGWIDNLNGPTGLIVGAGKGLLKILLCHGNMVADLIPVDVCTNFMITVAWYTATQKPNGLIVYNCTSGAIKPLLWRDIEHFGKLSMERNPFEDFYWPPGGTFVSSELLSSVLSFIFHTIPVYLIDFVRLLLGKKLIAIRLQKKFSRSIECLRYFTTHQWKFPTDNLRMLKTHLDETDRKVFDFDMIGFNWPSYIENYCLGVREYVLKQNPKSLPNARRYLKKMNMVILFVRIMFLLVCVRVVFISSNTIGSLWNKLMTFFCRTFYHVLFSVSCLDST